MSRLEDSLHSDPHALVAWLRGHGFAAIRVEALVGDVSLRRYLRAQLDDGGSVMVALYPESLTDACRRFVTTTSLLSDAGVPVPEVLFADCEAGVMVISDLGPTTVYERPPRDARGLAALFRQAAELAERISRLPADAAAALNPPLDAELLRSELERTRSSFFAPRALLAGRGDLEERLEAAFDTLCSGLDSEPPVPCHRDFMVRNLVATGRGILAVLDHQDLRPGPPFYDLASLLNDSLFPPAELERELVERYAGPRVAAYHRAAAQRTLKAVGTYASFAARGHDRHLTLIPGTLGRALGHLEALPDTAGLATELAAVLRSRGVFEE